MTGRDRGSWTSTARDRQGQSSVVVWSLIWVAGFLIADFAIGRSWARGEVAVIVVTSVVTLLGVGWVVAYVRFIRHVDELMRKIQLEAMAMALGTGFVAGFTLLLLEDADLAQARLSYLLVAMVVAYVGGVVAGLRRFGHTGQ
jgi:hypothetical protein